jgi:DNA-binding IclR family transcriptional regulator
MVSTSRESPVAVLSKAGALLDCLAEGELTPAELTARMGEPRSSVYRLIASLSELELIDPGTRTGTYRLGLKLLRLGGIVMASFDERRFARPIMEQIHEATGETVFLCIRRDFEAVCIDRIDGTRVQSLALKLGGALPLYAGAASRALLAFESEALRERYIDGGPFEALTPKTPTAAGELRDLLREVRRTGLAISDQDVTLGIAAVGAPIFGFDGQVRAALSTSGIRDAILGEHSQAATLTIEGAAEISRQLGYTPSDRREINA